MKKSLPLFKGRLKAMLHFGKCSSFMLGAIFLFGLFSKPAQAQPNNRPPIYIAFLWHMHQPIYWPYESLVSTINANRYPFSLSDVFNSRTGPYTTWPGDAVQRGINAGLGNFGAQVSFSGSLIENLNNLEQANRGFRNWKSRYNQVKNMNTVLGNPRLDMVGFGYHHPLMGLLDTIDMRRQIRWHKQIMAQTFNGAYSKGIFPPENAFTKHMIPALKAEGLEWVLVDNIHFDRACQGYPFSTNGNLYEMNKADQRNPNPNDWVQLNGLWAPTRNSAKWGRQPHYVSYIDPNTGQKTKIIAVPADRYMGNEDGRGGFGALNYEAVMSQLEQFNTDTAHPILIVLHHDGDNYGGGSDSYYQGNFQNFVNWVSSNPSRFRCTTIQDYLEMFPPDTTDEIHIEPGSWSGADNGDPEFKKWNGDPANCYSPDRNSWGVITAARHLVQDATKIAPNAFATGQAWKYLMGAQASCYWYWDNSTNNIWDTNPTLGANLAVNEISTIVRGAADRQEPTIYIPQREPYNPGDREWNTVQAANFTIWTYAYDRSGLRSVKLKFRTAVGNNTFPNNADYETYAGGPSVNAWQEQDMNPTYINPQTNEMPLVKAREYSSTITGIRNKLVSYFVEAVDSAGNIGRSIIQHTWVGTSTVPHTWQACGSPNGGPSPIPPIRNGISWIPRNPSTNDTITVFFGGATQSARMHWGVNGWQRPNNSYWPQGTALFQGNGPAVQTPFGAIDTARVMRLKIGPFNNPNQRVDFVNFVLNFQDNTWDNNNGADYRINISLPTEVNAAFKEILQVYPNPNKASGIIHIRGYNGEAHLKLYTALGQEISIQQLDSQTLQLPKSIAAGTYIIEAKHASGVLRAKLIIE